MDIQESVKMLIRGYRYTYKLNTAHDISDNGNQKHMHTFIVEVLISSESYDKFVTYIDMVRDIDDYFKRYENKFINDFEPFQQVKPTLENMANVFYKDLGKIVDDNNLKVIKLTISETPLNKYTVSDRLVFGDARYMI